MAGFHNVHCVNCGEECMSEGMAVDIDKLMRIHLEKIAATSENPVYQEAGEILSEIRLGMYLTKLEMVSRGLLDEDGYLQITGADVLEFIADRYQVELEEEENDSEDTFDKLCIRMRLYKEVDQDNSAIRNCIVNLILFLKENLNVVLLECSCNFHVNHDDQGGEYISSLQVIFIDGEVKELFHMVCPNCGEPFFIHAGKYEEKVIVMLGSPRVGKTAYLAALINEIDPEYGQSSYRDIVVQDTSDARYTYFKENILKQYQRGEKIQKTDEKNEVVPLFSVEVVINDRTLILTLVDLPGEVFIPRGEEERKTGEASGSFIINHRKICYAADAFWFCIAPEQIDQNVQKKRDKSSDKDQNVQKEKDKHSDEVERDLGKVLTNIGNMVSLIGKEIPTAVIITQSDLITEAFRLFAKNEQSAQRCLHTEHQLRVDTLKHIYSKNVMGYMQSANVKNIVPKLNNLFHEKNYFSVASYGREIEEGSSEGKDPYGIMLPFLWTLAVFGYLSPVKLEQVPKLKGKSFWRKISGNDDDDIQKIIVDADRTELFL